MIALPAFGLGGYLFLTGIGAGYGAVGYIPLATACFVVGGMVIAPPIAHKFGHRFSSIIFPDREFDRPQPKYSIPAARRAQGQSEEAFVGFQKIAEEYPDVARPYLEMMDIATRDLANPNLAAAIFQKAMQNVKGGQDRKELLEFYRDIRADFPELPPADEQTTAAASKRR
jgi:hypothetical protein